MSLVLIPDGPGTTVLVTDGPQGLPGAPRGTGAIMGQFPSGPTTKAALLLSKDHARLVTGEPDQNFEASLALDDAYSEYSPPMLAARVTDGLGTQARADLWDRDPARSFSKLNGTLVTLRTPMGTAKAHNVGRWGGRKRVVVGTLTAVATDLTSTTVDLGTSPQVGSSMLEDLLVGAELTFQGDTGAYEITSNDTDGVATIKGQFSQALVDATGSGSIDGRFRAILDHELELAVVVGQDNILGEAFSLQAARRFKRSGQWEIVSRYDNLQLGAADDRVWTTVVTNGEDGRYQFSITDLYNGSTVEAKLPCNFSEVPTAVSANVLTYQWYRWSKSGTGNGWLSAIAANDSSKIEPHVYTCTFTAATVFTVVVTWPDGTTETLSAAGATGSSFDPGHPQLTAFTITAGTVAFTAGAVVTIRVQPLPLDLYQREAFLYPQAVSADGNAQQRLRIVSNTYNTVSVRSDLSLSSYGSAIGTTAQSLGSVDLTAVTSTIGHTIILTPDGHVTTTLTYTTAVTGVTLIAAALTALDLSSKFIFDADSAAPTKLRIRVRGSFGVQSSLLVGAGTGNSAVGITATTTYGTDAIPFRIEARWPMWGGYDGAAPAAVRYGLAADLSDSLFKCYMNTNLGLVRVAAPGLTSADSGGVSAMDAITAFCEHNAWDYLAEFDPALESVAGPGEAAVASLMANFSESDHREWRFPSRADYATVSGQGTVSRSIMGQVIGRYALLANVGIDGEKGLHIAAANNNGQGRLSPRVKGLPSGLGRWTPPVKLLNDNGVVPILWEGPDVFMYGNRMYSVGRTPKGNRYTITERAVYYHVARDLFVTTRPNIFKSISARRLGEIQVQLRTKMKAYHADGWFSDQGGAAPGFEDQVIVELPANLNPASELLEGNVQAKITFTPRSALENLTITLAPTQTVAA